jgi:hypothetical protein
MESQSYIGQLMQVTKQGDGTQGLKAAAAGQSPVTGAPASQ